MDKSKIIALLELHLNNNISQEDADALFSWLQETSLAEFERILAQCDNIPDHYKKPGVISNQFIEKLEKHIDIIESENNNNLGNKARVISFLQNSVKYAAAVAVIVVGVWAWLHFNYKHKETEKAVALSPANIQPGKDGAILTLENGSQVLLDTVQNGVVALQGGATAIVKNGTLVYEKNNETEAVYNTMSTPKGRQYKMQLADGTMVWLNSASSIKYPVIFNKEERYVEVSGEVYFEVAKNKKQPFKVNVSNRMNVEVLGTHFNINAYDNEPDINATLLEGSVKVADKNNNVILKPGQQALLNNRPEIIVRKAVDLDQIMAWKNGLFNFEGLSFEEAMNQLERWYNIQVVYEKNVPDIRFGGKLQRSLSLNDLLDILEKTGVKFKLEEGRKLLVK